MLEYKKYRCSRCGYKKEIQTNHYGECYSYGHYCACPECPPWAKYPEFGGITTWLIDEKVPEGAVIPTPWEKHSLKELLSVSSNL